MTCFFYRNCMVGISPDFALGLFFAHVRVNRVAADGTPEPVYDSGHLMPFDEEAEAVAVAKKMAARWFESAGNVWGKSVAGLQAVSSFGPAAD
jgi:hypothetical protein